MEDRTVHSIPGLVSPVSYTEVKSSHYTYLLYIFIHPVYTSSGSHEPLLPQHRPGSSWSVVWRGFRVTVDRHCFPEYRPSFGMHGLHSLYNVLHLTVFQHSLFEWAQLSSNTDCSRCLSCTRHYFPFCQSLCHMLYQYRSLRNLTTNTPIRWWGHHSSDFLKSGWWPVLSPFHVCSVGIGLS